MTLRLDRVQEPVRQLRKSLERLPKDPPPETVHKLHTRARDIEAMATALTEPGEKLVRRLLKSLKPVRKAAGDVRDMDVLVGNLSSLAQNSHRESLLNLMEKLHSVRRKRVGDLLDTIDHDRKTARHALRKYAKFAEDRTRSSNAARIEAVIEGHLQQLRRWPALSERNLHRFRLKVKELRSILQLLPRADSALVKAFGDVKDKIGDWHDWQLLVETARKKLDLGLDHALVAHIEQIGRRKRGDALAAANTLRRDYLTLSKNLTTS